jgi:hypothetical protein
MKQLNIECLFQGLDMAGQGGLTDIHDPGRGGESAVCGNAVKGAKLGVEHLNLPFDLFI